MYGTQFFNNLIYYSADIGGAGLVGNTNANYGSLFIGNRGGRAAGNYVYSTSTAQLGSAASLLGGTWLNESFEIYAPNATPSATLSPLCVSAGYTTVTNGPYGKMARYQKLTSSSGGYLQFSLSANNSTPRPKGFISFKILQNSNSSVTSANQFFFRVGTNDTANISSAGNAFIDLRFTQDLAGTLKIYSAATQVGTDQTIGSTGVQTVRIWYNNTTNPFNYVDPSGVNQTLSSKSFVVFVGNNLKTPSASGSPMTTPGVATNDIGKIYFATGSSNQADFSVDDVYVGDGDNTISSSSGDDPLLTGSYDILSVPAGTS
ncbi:hypothetical protein EBS57_08210, partial [bacterium]|nr:hypothetical protein [bacterium]